jgi:hypothetical protein
MSRWVVGDTQSCRLIDNVLILADADIVSGITAAVPMNPLELQLHLRSSILLHGWLQVGGGCTDLSEPREGGRELITMPDIHNLEHGVFLDLNNVGFSGGPLSPGYRLAL